MSQAWKWGRRKPAESV